MNVAEIKRAVISEINGRVDHIHLRDCVNQAYVAITEDVEIPSLKTPTIVYTSHEPYAPLPKYYSRLLFAGNPDPMMVLEGGVSEMEKRFPGLQESGEVTTVSLDDTKGGIWYQGIPKDSQPVVLLLYSLPPSLLHDSDVPHFIPEFAQMILFVQKTIKLYFNYEGDSIAYLESLASVSRWIDGKKKNEVADIWSRV